MQFLTPTESQAIASTQMSVHAKFLTRITIHAWRVLLHIAQAVNSTVETIAIAEIITWMESDAQIRRDRGVEAAFLQWSEDNLAADFEDPIQDQVTAANLSSPEKFLTRMMISALETLRQMGEDNQVAIADLNIDQIIQWIETHQQQSEGVFLRTKTG
jgi:hypothetical protein